MTTLKVRQLVLPEGLDGALRAAARTWEYSSLEEVLDCLWLYDNKFIGTCGDPGNGAYEWFFWTEGQPKAETSNCGYGSATVALRDILNREEPV